MSRTVSSATRRRPDGTLPMLSDGERKFPVFYFAAGSCSVQARNAFWHTGGHDVPGTFKRLDRRICEESPASGEPGLPHDRHTARGRLDTTVYHSDFRAGFLADTRRPICGRLDVPVRRPLRGGEAAGVFP